MRNSILADCYSLDISINTGSEEPQASTENLSPQESADSRLGITPVDRSLAVHFRRNILPYFFQIWPILCSSKIHLMCYNSISNAMFVRHSQPTAQFQPLTMLGAIAQLYSAVPSFFSTSIAGCAIP